MITQLTIVCNGELWIENNLRHHSRFVDKQVVVEGASTDGHLGDGLAITGGSFSSTDSTISILQRLENELPNLKVVYSTGKDRPWQGKTEMCNAALEHCSPGFIMQIDADEFWFEDQVRAMVALFQTSDYTDYTDFEFYARHFYPDCNTFTGFDKNTWGNKIPWRRLFKWNGEKWRSHEPPRFDRQEKVMGMDSTLSLGFVMHHYGYAVAREITRREKYYGYNPGQLKSQLESSPIKQVKYDAAHPLDVSFMLCI